MPFLINFPISEADPEVKSVFSFIECVCKLESHSACYLRTLLFSGRFGPVNAPPTQCLEVFVLHEALLLCVFHLSLSPFRSFSLSLAVWMGLWAFLPVVRALPVERDKDQINRRERTALVRTTSVCDMCLFLLLLCVRMNTTPSVLCKQHATWMNDRVPSFLVIVFETRILYF